MGMNNLELNIIFLKGIMPIAKTREIKRNMNEIQTRVPAFVERLV